MQKTKKQSILKKLIITEDDYNLLNASINMGVHRSVADRRNADMIQAELRKAKLVNKNEFPRGL